MGNKLVCRIESDIEETGRDTELTDSKLTHNLRSHCTQNSRLAFFLDTTGSDLTYSAFLRSTVLTRDGVEVLLQCNIRVWSHARAPYLPTIGMNLANKKKKKRSQGEGNTTRIPGLDDPFLGF